MLFMSKEYKQSMHDNTKMRNRSHMIVTIGVINQAAQKDCTAAEEQGASYSYLSNLIRPLNNYDVEFEYATMEQDWFKADGEMLFPPRPEAAEYLFNNGIMTSECITPICFVFGTTYDIRGLSIDWGRNYPVDFTISNGEKTMSVSGNTETLWTTDEIFEATEYLVITPTLMSQGENRLRVNKIQMGIGISFENKKIKSSSKSEYISPIAEELPALDFSLTADNANRMFDVENKDSAIHYLEIGQEVTVRYGYEIVDGGDITWMDGCVCLLSGWEADDEVLSFSAKDRIDSMDETYYRGTYNPDGISLYDLAVDVLTDAGFDERYYDLDEYLQTVTVQNPMPCVTHKECLQLIANAGRCKLYVDRLGVICIKAAFVTVVAPERMTVESDYATSWSNLPSVVNGAAQYEYATLSQDYFKTDGSMYFLPRSGSYLPAGFVSEAVADADGNFEVNPRFTIILEAAMSYYSLQINFYSNPAQGMIIHTYYEGELKESYEPAGPFELENIIEHEFQMFDSIEFEFTKGQPNSRIFVESVTFGEVTDYRMDYKIMTSYPKGRQTEKVGCVDVLQNIYGPAAEEENIFQEEIDVTDLTEYTFFFSSPTYDVNVTAGDEEVEITDSSSYFATIDVSSLTGTQEFFVNGKEYSITNKIRSKTINSTGKVEEWDNPLISDADLADLQAEWLGNYFYNNIEYEIKYRGEPRLDAGDIVFLENQYVENLQIQLYEHKLSYNGALSGTIKARRAVSQ